MTAFLLLLQVASAVQGRARPDSVSFRFSETELKTVIQALGQHLTKPVFVVNAPSLRITFETPVPVARDGVAELLRSLVEAHGLVLDEDSTSYRVASAPPPPPAPTPAQQAGPIRLHVIRLKHAKAFDVAATVNLLFGGGGSLGERPGLSGGTLGDELRQNLVSPQTTAGPPAGATPAAQANGSRLAGQVTLVPDDITNSLLVRASDADFAAIREAVEQLDVRPLQVLLEVLIVEARADKSFSLGADLFVSGKGGPGTDVEVETFGGGLGDLVIQLLHIGRRRIEATLRTAQSKGFVEIMSRPVLLASNNAEARLLVGAQRPFVQVSRSLPTDTPTRDQVIQYKEVGTKLVVRPTINDDGYLSLLIRQEVNSATSEVQFDAPVIATREAVTQVLVRDGQTIVLGGLRDHQKERSQSGIPVLSGIPILGGLFGSANRRATSTELYLFLTPRILRTDEDADAVTVPRLPPEEKP